MINRGDQRSEDGTGLAETLRVAMANYLTLLYVSILCLAVITYSELLDLPSLNAARTLLFG